MQNNELLSSICSALDLSEEDLSALLALCNDQAGLQKESEPQASLLKECSNGQLRCVLEGLILAERGPRSDGSAPNINSDALTNNDVLKKLRIALNLQQENMLLIFEEGGATLTDSELGALFRKEGNKHFRACSDELLLQFLGGFQSSLDT